MKTPAFGFHICLLFFLLSAELNKTKCSKLPFEKVPSLPLINKLYVSKVLCREHSIYASNREIFKEMQMVFEETTLYSVQKLSSLMFKCV